MDVCDKCKYNYINRYEVVNMNKLIFFVVEKDNCAA